jgi:DHA2 family multidrug resistance protein
MVVIGIVLFSTMALASPLFQNAFGFPILTAGLLLATRGMGTFVAMMLVSRLMHYLEARTLIGIGLALIAITLYDMTGWTADTQVRTIIINSVIQGFGLGLVFVPLSTVAFLTLPDHLRTDGTSMLTLVRNVASSVGISIVIAELTQGTRRVHAVLVEHVTPFNQALQMPDVSRILNLGTDTGRAMMDMIVNAQAQIIAFSQDFELVALVTICAIPLVLMLSSSKAAMLKPQSDHAAVME